MRFELNITLTESDYVAFNRFHAIESTQGKKTIRNSRILFVSIIAVLMILFVFSMGWTAFSALYVTIMALFTTVYCLFFKKILIRNLEAQIKKMKKSGKLPFDPISKAEFYEDKFADISPSKRMELGYEALERICILDEQYIFLYQSSVTAHILPIPQIKAQICYDDFLSFLFQKCSKVEHY